MFFLSNDDRQVQIFIFKTRRLSNKLERFSEKKDLQPSPIFASKVGGEECCAKVMCLYKSSNIRLACKYSSFVN